MLTRDKILTLKDIEVKEIVIPQHIPGWGGETAYIKQLTRGQQDTYLKRQFSATKMKQDKRAKSQEIGGVQIYGHDVFLVICGLCDENGTPIFKESDEAALTERNGEAIGWIAQQIVKHSGMGEEAKEIAAVEEEVKN